ncbi:MAG: magnesium transporter [Ruminococcus sp.]|jgi:magnesium transporter|nr:magnesium transporter [Ruminococcus sp.]
MNIEEVMPLLQEKKLAALRSNFEQMHPADIAALFSELIEQRAVSDTSLILIYRVIAKETAAEAFTYMDPSVQETLINSFSDRELSEVIDELYIDDAVDMIEEMPANVVSRILKNADSETRSQINNILKYPEDSAGSIMTTEFVYFRKGKTIAECFERIRSVGIMKETIYTCYVTDQRKLIGAVNLLEMITAEPATLIEDIAESNIITVNTLDDKESVAKTLSKYDLHAIPVVDNEERIVGIVTFDDAIDVIEEENTEDFSKMAAVAPLDESYFKTTVWHHARSRLPWLLFLMLSATLTGFVISRYETAFEKLAILIAFMPMIMGTAGNSGSQSSTLIIRGMAVDEIHLRDFFKVLWKEFRVALICGAVLAVVNGLRIYYFEQAGLLVSLTVGLSIVGVVILAKIVGSMLPMFAKKVHLDPAIMATPMISTILDTCSLLLYFTLATAILHV